MLWVNLSDSRPELLRGLFDEVLTTFPMDLERRRNDSRVFGRSYVGMGR